MIKYSYQRIQVNDWIRIVDLVVYFCCDDLCYCVNFGLILGELVEGTLRQSLVIFDGNWLMFFTRPIALTFFILSLIALAFPLIRSKKFKKTEPFVQTYYQQISKSNRRAFRSVVSLNHKKQGSTDFAQQRKKLRQRKPIRVQKIKFKKFIRKESEEQG